VRGGSTELQAEARAVFGEAARFGEPMARYTLYRIGGPAALFVHATSRALLQAAPVFAAKHELPLFVIGLGSNLLVPDGGLDGVVVRVEIETLRVEGAALAAGAGVPLGQAARAALEHTLSGLEFCVGIPGSMGGALVMNAGCRGCEIGTLVEQVEVVGWDGTLRTVGREACAFSYRSSDLHALGAAVAGATLRLEPDDAAAIERRMDEHRMWRMSTQPLGLPNAGSVFKNPPGDAAGRLIDAAGCKGLRVGGAEVSDAHANFIVNRGGATCADVSALIETMRARVEQQFGVPLELELVDLGAGGKGATR